MLQIPVAKVAVLAATFAFDRPYTYKIPQPLAAALRPGCRVMVPFSRGNRPCEGMVLALGEAEDDPKLKPITRQLDPEPILSQELLRLAVWMHDRFFCTIYDALHAILPAGVWYRVSTAYCTVPELDTAAALTQCVKSKQRRLALETVLEHGRRARQAAGVCKSCRPAGRGAGGDPPPQAREASGRHSRTAVHDRPRVGQ
mgnify:CR=1 FL=1